MNEVLAVVAAAIMAYFLGYAVSYINHGLTLEQ